MISDTEFMRRELEKGSRTTMQLIIQSVKVRGCGLTPHSRAADLRRQGVPVVCSRVVGTRGRPVYRYRIEGQS